MDLIKATPHKGSAFEPDLSKTIVATLLFFLGGVPKRPNVAQNGPQSRGDNPINPQNSQKFENMARNDPTGPT